MRARTQPPLPSPALLRALGRLGLAALLAGGCAAGSGDAGGGASGAGASDSSEGGGSTRGGDSGTSGATTSAGGSGTSEGEDEDAAAVVSADLPGSLACGASYPARVTMRNTGARSWAREGDGGVKLGAVGDEDALFDGTRVYLEEGVEIAPGATHSFEFTLTAPPEPGTYVTEWRMVREGVAWFGEVAAQEVEVACDPQGGGAVGLDGNSLVDEDGPFNALGATMMWAAWAYKFDRPRLEANLAYLRDHGFDYIRALGVVGDYDGPDYWDGREIDWRWPDYAAVIAGLTDLAYDAYGLRVEWTLMGDAQKNLPDPKDRKALVDTFLAMSKGREGKIIHFEIANEYWQNGFDGASGLAELRALSKYMKDRTAVLVAASAPAGYECEEDILAVYGGGVADLATIHFDRDVWKVEGPWRPVRQPWEHGFCAGVPVGSNNEPIGPGSSVAEESDPERLVAAALVTYIAGLPLYVFHSHAGVRGDEDLWEAPAIDAFAAVRPLIPGDLASWAAKNAHWADAPLQVFAGAGGQLYPDMMWVDVDAPESGVVRAYGAVKGDDFLVLPIGILGEVVMAPRKDAELSVIDILSGAVVDQLTRAAGEPFTVSGAGARLIRGRYL